MARVLIIDDEDHFRESLSERLRLRGYDNITLNGGKNALNTVQSNKDIDVVILDRKMPDVSGDIVLQEIKSYMPALPVIMLTGHGYNEDFVETNLSSAFKLLQKPVELESLLNYIDSARIEKTGS